MPEPALRPRRLLPWLLTGVLLLPAGGRAGDDDGGESSLLPTGEVFVSSLGRVPWRVLRDEATGRKVLEDPSGVRRESVEAIVLAEEEGLPDLRRRVHRSLWDAVEDPGRGEETLRVVLVLGEQPVRAAAAAARPAAEEAMAEPLGRAREILARVGPLREPDPLGTMQLGDRLEEEWRLLSEAEREELRDLRRTVQARARAFREEVVAAAFPLADALLAPVRARVAAAPGARVLGSARVLASVSAELRAGEVAPLLGDLPQVARVLPHGTRTVGLDTSVATLGASSWTGAGYDGSSTTKVAVLDTGIDSGHPALGSVVGDEAVFLGAGELNPYFADDATSHDDLHGHGTHVGGIVMSADGTYGGVAPGGVLMDAKCGYLMIINAVRYGSLEDADIMAAGDWAVSNGADGLNGSFGGGGTTDGGSALSLFFDAVVDDLAVSAALAAGNAGPSSGTVGIPGDAFNVLTVGSLDDKGTASHSDNAISGFSSRGPLDDGRRKPDFAAPGSNIVSCNATWEGAGADFVNASGTSMATPHAAGSLALLYDYAASWRPEALKALMAGTARNASPYPAVPDDTWGTGGLDLATAFTRRGTVAEGTLPSSGPATAFLLPGTLNAGQRVTLCWNREALANGADAPVTYRAPADLDLHLYDQATGASLGSSTSSLDTVEQAKVASTTTFPVIKVLRYGSMPSGQTAVRWAVATEASTATRTAVAPTPSCSFATLPAAVRGGEEFAVEAAVTNLGDLPAFDPAVTLTLPGDYQLVSGENPATVVTIPGAETVRTVSWTVRAGTGASGDRTFSLAATTDSFEESFASAPVASDQFLDTGGPTGFVTLAGGKAAVPGPTVALSVIAFDDGTGVSEMRVRNGGGAWEAWGPYLENRTWTLPAGDGPRTVEVQLRDGVGNESAILSDSVLQDGTPPAGAFALAGGAEYLMPWEPLTAETAADDGEGGSGVAAFRYRWSATGAWSPWVALDGGPTVPVDRPAAEEGVVAEGEFQDGAGNLSARSTDGIHLVPAEPPSLGAVKSWKGRLDPDGDLDSFVVDLVAGDALGVKVKAKSLVRKGRFEAALDLFDPAGERVATGRYPAGARKAGIDGFVARDTGRHWIVLRPEGEDRAAGGAYGLAVKVKRPRANRSWTGEALPGGEPSQAAIPFAGSSPWVLKGTLVGADAGPFLLLPPGGGSIPVETAVSKSGKVTRIAGTALAGGAGDYLLVVPASGPVAFQLVLSPPKRTKVVEGEE